MIMPDAARYRMPWGNSWRKRADQRCSAISFWTRHPPNWARHRVDHGTITGRGGDKFGARKAVFACNGCAFSPRPPREKIVRVMSAGVSVGHHGFPCLRHFELPVPVSLMSPQAIPKVIMPATETIKTASTIARIGSTESTGKSVFIEARGHRTTGNRTGKVPGIGGRHAPSPKC